MGWSRGSVPPWTLAALAIWPALVVPGFVFVERYSHAPGRLAEPPSTWPADLSVARSDGRYTLVMLAHPRCPCTRSSIRELARLMAGVHRDADAVVLFVDPVGADWAQTDLWRSAAAIPGVSVLADARGAIAERLGAYTSGQVLLYDPDGRLAFNGGVTPGRGHDGSSPGQHAILTIVRGETAEPPALTSSVFGCDLWDPESAE